MKTGQKLMAIGATLLTLYGLNPINNVSANESKKPVIGSQISTEISKIDGKEQDPRLISETFVNNLPGDSELYIYANAQKTENGENTKFFFKGRGISLPIKLGPAELGFVGQYVAGDPFPAIPKTEVGLNLRLQGPIGQDFLFGKIDFRYLRDLANGKETFDSYGFLSSQKWFLDNLTGYNPKTGKTMLKPGLDFKINKNLSVGVYGQFSGDLNNPFEKTTEVGIRLKKRF